MELNEEEGIIIEESREEHWRDVAEDTKDTSKVNALRWDVYTRDKKELGKIYIFGVHNKLQKGGTLFGLV